MPTIEITKDYRIRDKKYAWVFEKRYSYDKYEKWHSICNCNSCSTLLDLVRKFFLRRSNDNAYTEVLEEVENLIMVARKSEERLLREDSAKEYEDGGGYER